MAMFNINLSSIQSLIKYDNFSFSVCLRDINHTWGKYIMICSFTYSNIFLSPHVINLFNETLMALINGIVAFRDQTIIVLIGIKQKKKKRYFTKSVSISQKTKYFWCPELLYCIKQHLPITEIIVIMIFYQVCNKYSCRPDIKRSNSITPY